MEKQFHICGQCGGKFGSEKRYLDHTCKTTGVTPRDPESMGNDYAAVQDAAVERGQEDEE